MSENINEVLNVSLDTEIEKKDELSLSEEMTLRTIADIVLVVGIISSLILFFTITIINVPGSYSWETKTGFSAAGMVNTLGVLFSSIAVWAFFRVISNISISLKELNRKNFGK